MSIEYYVEGKTTIQTEGNNLTFAKEDITYNTGKNVNQKGIDTGVSFNKPTEIHPNDTPVNIIEVSLNLFFDGTQNNKTNTELGKDYKNSNHEDDSYTNDFSNVARGYDAIDPATENQFATYIEGIGTEDQESESIIFTTKPNNRGIPFGTGPRGIKAKVTKGCINGADAVKSYAGKDIHLKVNVFGFSRGSAAARHFLHIATSSVIVYENSKGFLVQSPYDEDPMEDAKSFPKKDAITDTNGYFGACLLFWNVIPKKISFNFIGLYDTVASYGMNHRGGYGIDNDTKQLGLIAVSKANFVLQIAADDEYRDNFDLTNINSSTLKGLEFTLPGVHSDIGGCYVNNAEEKVDIFQEIGNFGSKAEEFRKILIEEGWYADNKQLRIDYIPRISLYGEVKGGGESTLAGTRTLFNTYDKIPLNTMFHYSKQFDIKYDETLLLNHNIEDGFLNSVHSQLISYMNACNVLRSTYIPQYNISNTSGDYLSKLKTLSYFDFIRVEDLKTLRNKYLHWSASVTAFGLGPKIGEVTNGKERKRNIQNG